MEKMKLNIQLFSLPYTYLEFEDYPSTDTPLDSTNLNQMQNAIHNEIKSFTPVGVINSYAGSTAPTGWLICNGSAISRTDYAELFNVIGTTYGSGDGSTTFNLPDLRGRVAMGSGSHDGGTHSFTLGSANGEYEHTLTVGEMPQHFHEVSHSYLPNGGTSRWGINGINTGGDLETTSSQGNNEPHNIIQPYLTLNYIIKY